MPYTEKQRAYFHRMAKHAKTAKERAQFAKLAKEADAKPLKKKRR